MSPESFDMGCRECDRLVAFLADVKSRYPDYHAATVPPFGDADARLLIVGLAPGMHGANASGRPFTGDHAGILLYQTLFEYGFSSAAESVHKDDGLQLHDCRITNAVKCLPPGNKPVGSEMSACNRFLAREIAGLGEGAVIVALGGIAHKAVISALGLRQAGYRFGHAAEYELPGRISLIDSYHCSRYNTQTRRLTADMFRQIFARSRALVDQPA